MTKWNNEDFQSLHVKTFDLEQYNHNARHLIATIFVTYRTTLYFHDEKIWIPDYCEWKDDKWVLYKNLDELKYRGLQYLTNYIEHEQE